MRSSELVAIIPARDEESTLRAVVRKALAHAAAVVVVDDGSRDRTSAAAKAAGASVVRTERPHGYGSALLAGLGLASTRGFTCFATLDADGAHDPDDLDIMFRRHVSAKHDLTIGDRFTRSRPIQEVPSPKRWANHFATAIVNRTCGSKIGDVACGLRLMSSRFVHQLLLEPHTAGFGFAYELIGLARRRAFRLGSAPVSVHYDAKELHCTGRQELLDLLGVCVRHSRGQLRRQLALVRDRVWRYRIAACRVGGKVVILLPLQERQAYVFQLQDDVFSQTDIVTLDK